MKRKLIIPIIILAVLIIAAIVIFIIFSVKSLSFSKGHCLVADNGEYLLITEDSAIVLSNRTKSDKLFDGLDSGDEIIVLHDGIQETYPAGTGAYAVFKTADGDISDIREPVIDSLTELGGWFDEKENISASTQSGEDLKSTFSRVNFSDDSKLSLPALNADKLSIDSVMHLPIIRFESSSELESFKQKYSSELIYNRSDDDFPSFDEATADFDEAFFQNHTVFAVYIPANSGSFRYSVNSIYNSGESFCIHVEQTSPSEAVTMDLVSWMGLIAVDKESVKDCTEFDADLNNLLY